MSPFPLGKVGMGLLFAFLLSCGPKKEPLPTDMVGIPANAEKGLDRSELPDIKFDEDVFDFGTITQGEKRVHEFMFENTGNKPLIISNAYADCGCTVAEVPPKPIAPGERNRIRVSFNSEKKSGIVNKTISIVTNCMPNKRIVKIKANIFVAQTKNQ